MAVYYFDASAVVKYYVTEPGSTWVRQLIDARDPGSVHALHLILVAEVTRVEVAAGHPFTFVSGDATLQTAARAEGLTTETPFDHLTPEEQPGDAG
jgi:predicted nucleic acid-binding protein